MTFGQSVRRVVLGDHPNNTRASFNFHNVRHVVAWMDEVGAAAGSLGLVVDVGGGAAPYRRSFQAARYLVVDLEDATPADVEYLEGAAEALPLADGVADVVVMNQVLEHVVDPAKAVSEARRVLKPGGLFVGSIPHISPVHLEPHDYRRFTDLGVRQILAGFVDVEVSGSGGVWSAAALLVTMDWMITPRSEGHRTPQKRVLLLAPLVFLINLIAGWLDRLRDSGRSPANLCWSAIAGRVDDESG
jgi:SAM-dependent methyltransferase